MYQNHRHLLLLVLQMLDWRLRDVFRAEAPANSSGETSMCVTALQRGGRLALGGQRTDFQGNNNKTKALGDGQTQSCQKMNLKRYGTRCVLLSPLAYLALWTQHWSGLHQKAH